MNELIPITESLLNGEPKPTVNARELHAFLGVGKDFTNWVKAQIERARLKENRDFLVYAQKGEKGGRPSMEYFLTLDAAKHVAMMSGSDKGHEAREYFLECERRANQPMTMAERLLASAQLLVDHERKLADLSYRQAETQAQVRALVDGEDYYTIVGYGNLIGEPVDTPRSRRLGKIATKICREHDWRIGSANHPVYGPIHSYPRQAVALAFDQEQAA